MVAAIKTQKSSFDSPDLSRAKNRPIPEIFPKNITLKQFGNKYMACCPFHQEDTPSFAIFVQTNSWYCFAEGIGGDSIAFYQKLHNTDFKTALEALK